MLLFFIFSLSPFTLLLLRTSGLNLQTVEIPVGVNEQLFMSWPVYQPHSSLLTLFLPFYHFNQDIKIYSLSDLVW